MKILFVVRSIGYGGASKQLVLTANALAELGHDVVVYSYCWNTPYAVLSNKTKYIPSKEYGKTGEYLHAIPNIRKVVKKEKPDVIISWRANAGCFTRIATLGLPCRVVYSERTDPYMETSMFLKFATWICGFSDGGVFQTDEARNYYKRLVQKSVVIPNPFRYEKELPQICPSGERVNEIALVARFFLPQKRHDIAITAFERVLKRFPSYKLALYGSGSDEQKIRDIVESKGLTDKVIFKGAVPNVIESIRRSKIMILSSDYEGIPNVILEAFAAGVPVVSTDCSPGGARLLIKNGINGFIVPTRNPKDLANQVMAVISSEEDSNRFIAQGRKKLNEFKPDIIFDKWDKYLQEVTQTI